MGPTELTAMLLLMVSAAATIHGLVERPGRHLLPEWMVPKANDPVEARRSIRSDQGEPF